MNLHLRVATFAAICLLVGASVLAQSSSTVKITPNVNPKPGQRSQPFGGEIRFSSQPTLGKACSLKVSLTAQDNVQETAVFRVVKSEVYAVPFSPDSIIWDLPIDSGKTKNFSFAFKPILVGSYRLSLAQRSSNGWMPLAGISVDINEDGKTVCSGPVEKCGKNIVSPHPKRSADKMTIEFPINELENKRLQDRHFSAAFTITPGKALRDTTIVDFQIECHVGLYSEVQFAIEHSGNIMLSPLPESWGDKAGPNPDYRFYKGRLSFVSLKSGLAYMNFKVIGRHPSAKTNNWITTEFPMYLVTNDSSEVLFLGDFDPFARFKDATDPMLGTLGSLLDVKNRDFKTRVALSKPDYRGIFIDARDGTDTTESDSTKK